MSREQPRNAGDPPEEQPSLTLDDKITRAIDSFDHAAVLRLATEGIVLYPRNPKYLVDRAAANVCLNNYSDAIADARNALMLDTDHKNHRAMPYLHMGRALIGLTELDAAFTIANEGFKIDPEDWRLPQCMELARVAGIAKRARLGSNTGQENIGDTFDGGEMWLKLERDAEVRGYRHDPEFRRKVFRSRKDNLKLRKYLREDDRILKSLGILLNIRFRENIWGAEAEAEFEIQELTEDDREGNKGTWIEKLRRDMISAMVDFGPTEWAKSSQPLKEGNREREMTAEEAVEMELAKELLKLALEGTTIVEED